MHPIRLRKKTAFSPSRWLNFPHSTNGMCIFSPKSTMLKAKGEKEWIRSKSENS